MLVPLDRCEGCLFLATFCVLSGCQDDQHLDILCLQQGSVTFLDCLPAEVGWIMVKEREEREGKHGKKQALPSPSWTLSFPGKV